jgi:predicted membrane-bound dolichyl-phosphate-mannose-protein mannosyltransferase
MTSVLILRKRLIRFHIGYLLLISSALHISVISFPSDGGKVFDEAFYVPAANDILKGVPSNMEHPFLGKLWGAIGIAAFGDNWLGWRAPAVIFGMLTLYVFYLLAKHFLDESKALAAATFLSFDIIFFTHSSLLLLEVPALFFGILGFYLYLKNRNLLAATSFGLAILSKEWAIMFVVALLLYHLMINRSLLSRYLFRKPMLAKARSRMTMIAKFSLVLFGVVMVPSWVYILLYHPTNIANPIDQIKYILGYQSSLTIQPDSKVYWYNYPWGWIIPYKIEPMVYFETAVTETTETSSGALTQVTALTKRPISWNGIADIPIWASIWFVVPSAINSILGRRASKLDYLIIAWIVATYLPWFYVSGIMHRLVYTFYFINVVPILALGIPYFIASISKGKYEKLITLAWLSASILFFIYYFPVRPWDF